MTYDCDSDPTYAERPFPKLCFLHGWGWEVIESSPGRFRLIAGDWRPLGYIATFKSKDAAVDYMNAEFL